MDTTLATAMYQNYLIDSVKQEKYNTPSSTFARGNYLSFKLVDANESTYKSIKALVELQDAVKSNADSKSINAFLEVVKDCYSDKLKALEIFDDNAKVKTWALNYADTVTAYGLTGAKAILNSTKDRENEDSIWSKVFDKMLTNEYIQEKLDDYLDDECKITIYDSLFDAQFAQNHEFYKQGSKTSKENVLKIKVNGKEHIITANDLFTRLENKYGANTSATLLLNQIVKEKYYDQITQAKKKEYEKEYEQVITYFASGQSSQFGYTPAIGQKAFINLYFQADNKEDAIFNMWVAKELQNILIYDNPTDILSNILDSFTTLTTDFEQNNYVNIEYNQLYIYTDDDEDGEADDWSLVDDSDARKQQVKKLSAQLINILNERAKTEYSNDNRSSAYNDYRSKYHAASRISTIGDAALGDPVPSTGFSTTSEQDAYYFAYFKANGLFLEINAQQAINTLKDLRALDDDLYENQLKAMYQYMLENHGSDLTVDQIIARTMDLGDAGLDIDEATADNIFTFEKGYATFYVYNCKKAPVFKFEPADNADTSSGGKVYPYSTDKNNPFPTDDDGKPIDNSAAADTLYNSTDNVSLNQLLVYIREYKTGVESLSADVLDAFTSYVEEDIVKTYVSDNFLTFISYTLINKYIADGKITIDSELNKKLTNFTKYRLEAMFQFEENEFTSEWFTYFNIAD